MECMMYHGRGARIICSHFPLVTDYCRYTQQTKWVRAESRHTPTPRHVVFPWPRVPRNVDDRCQAAASPRHNYLINQRIHSLLHNQHTLGHSITTPSQDDTINDWAEMVSISRTFIDYHQIPRDSRKSGEWKILLRSDVIKVENILAVYTVKLA